LTGGLDDLGTGIIAPTEGAIRGTTEEAIRLDAGEDDPVLGAVVLVGLTVAVYAGEAWVGRTRIRHTLAEDRWTLCSASWRVPSIRRGVVPENFPRNPQRNAE
jgi:hypothetical protein